MVKASSRAHSSELRTHDDSNVCMPPKAVPMYSPAAFSRELRSAHPLCSNACWAARNARSVTGSWYGGGSISLFDSGSTRATAQPATPLGPEVGTHVTPGRQSRMLETNWANESPIEHT